jgi:hypothetical protein
MTTMLTMLDPDTCPDGDMYDELLWFETLSRIGKKRHTSEDEVRAFLRDTQGRPDLAEAFKASYLLAVSQ